MASRRSRSVTPDGSPPLLVRIPHGQLLGPLTHADIGSARRVNAPIASAPGSGTLIDARSADTWKYTHGVQLQGQRCR